MTALDQSTGEGEPNLDPRERKTALRRAALARRSALDAGWRAAASADLTRHLLAWPPLAAARTVALFCSYGDEIDTHPLIAELIRRRGAVALPRCRYNPRRLEFRLVRDFPAALASSKYGILEPQPATCPEVVEAAALDLVVVPAVLFDAGGFRIGYGGGFYDELLARLAPAARTIGIAFSSFVSPTPLPRAHWDRPVQALCTEEGIRELPTL